MGFALPGLTKAIFAGVMLAQKLPSLRGQALIAGGWERGPRLFSPFSAVFAGLLHDAQLLKPLQVLGALV